MATATDSRVVPLSGRREVAERTLEFRFPKPRSMTFKAGQFMDLTLLDPSETDAEGNTRGFSINSAPDDPELIFTTRLRDTAFKRVLHALRAMYRKHIAVEDNIIFPMASRALEPEQITSVGQEMAQRRGVPYDTRLDGSRCASRRGV